MLILHCGGASFRYDRFSAGMQACSLSPFLPIDLFYGFLRIKSRHSIDVQLTLPLIHFSPLRGPLCSIHPWSLPVFGPSGCPDSLAAHRSDYLAAQQPSAYQRSRASALILFRAG